MKQRREMHQWMAFILFWPKHECQWTGLDQKPSVTFSMHIHGATSGYRYNIILAIASVGTTGSIFKLGVGHGWSQSPVMGSQLGEHFCRVLVMEEHKWCFLRGLPSSSCRPTLSKRQVSLFCILSGGAHRRFSIPNVSSQRVNTYPITQSSFWDPMHAPVLYPPT